MDERRDETRVRVQGDKDTACSDGLANRSEPPWSTGDQLGEFVLEAFLGEGTSGVVYRAFDQVTQRHCALKLLLPTTPEDLVRNKLGFRRMMSIRHPNLMRVDRIHQLSEYIALSMEEVEGDTLPDAVRRLRDEEELHVAYRQLEKLARDYASGLAAMHAQGYVHRDIKPHNLMVDNEGNGRVIDYGLVGTFDLEDDPQGGVRSYLAGTAQYIAPETWWDQVYLPAGDIFGLGVVMLEALRMICKGQNHRSKIDRDKKSQSKDAKQIDNAIKGLDKSVPNDLREICLEMLQRQPGDRPTAMRVARLGLSNTTTIHWPEETPLIGRQRDIHEMKVWLEGIYAGNVGRLHLTGPSGIGKTRLVDDVEMYIRGMRWGQVFRARCRPREDQPLQAFDQICDTIATRYKRGDREKLDLDYVSAATLQSVFPVLKSVLKSSYKLTPAEQNNHRLDALEAAARMSVELRKVGPLILIIDDSQWADRDSLNVLDRLQKADADIGLGIITVARQEEDPQRLAADHYLHLKPLENSDAIEMLSSAAARNGIIVGEAMLDDLVEVAGGNPFRLHELCDEFGPNGALSQIEFEDADDSVSQLGQIDLLWQRRAARLSSEAHRVLAYVVTAGRAVSTQQLGELTGLGDAVDAAVSELAQQRLVSDEATGGECIQIVHDRVADGLITTLDKKVEKKAHQKWAVLWENANNPRFAARIAGHYFAADAPGRALSFAIQAAEQAEELLAFTEAARWHAMLVEHVDGSEKVQRIRDAARCYEIADHPAEAAKYFRRLADHEQGIERIKSQMQAVGMSIRSGRIKDVRDQLVTLGESLQLPTPKPKWKATVSLIGRSLTASMRPTIKLLEKSEETPGDGQPSSPGIDIETRDRHALELCLSLARPLSMFDNLYAAELHLYGEKLAARYGSNIQRVNTIVGRSVFGCYDSGRTRTAAELALLELRPRVEALDDPSATGDLWSGIAFTHALSCRWNRVSDPVRYSIKHYSETKGSRCFEIAHTQWLDVWASWHLGRWDSMIEINDQMVSDAIRRNDLFQRMLVTSGMGASAWLARDRTRELDNLLEYDAGLLTDQSMQMFHVFRWITATHRLIYDGKFELAWQVYRSLEAKLGRMPHRRLQMMRVIRQSLGALISLHMLNTSGSQKWIVETSKRTAQLRRERLEFSKVMADFYDGLIQSWLSTHENESASKAATVYLRAAAEAADDQKLRPVQLAALDMLAAVRGEERQDLLRGRMQRHGVTSPALFERLYTVRLVGERARRHG